MKPLTDAAATRVEPKSQSDTRCAEGSRRYGPAMIRGTKHIRWRKHALLVCIVIAFMNKICAFAPISVTSTERLLPKDDDGPMNYAKRGDNDDQAEANIIDRRQALQIPIGAASALLLSSASASQALAQDMALEPLESMGVGQGSWSMKADSSGNPMAQLSIDDGNARFVPPVFAVYTARFLLKYDMGASQWWAGTKGRYSLLSDEERQAKLDANFGKFARSVAIGLEAYLQGTSETFDVDPTLPGTKKDGRAMVRSKSSGVSITVSEKYAQIANTFARRYTSDVTNAAEGQEISRQLALAFSMLPQQYQPLSVLEQLVQVAGFRGDKPVVLPRNMNRKQGVLGVPGSMKSDYDVLLPSIYSAIPFVTSTLTSLEAPAAAYTVSPPISLFANSVGKGSTITPFGPLASVPLSRDKAANLQTYFLYGLSGGTGCALTHTVVVPLDVVKTRLQTNPDQYDGIIGGATTIVKEEGLSALMLGLQATIAGYFWYGISVYPSYSFFKYAISTWLLSPDVAVANASFVALVAGAMSAVLASLGLTPLEAARIRTVAEPEIYRAKGLTGTLATISAEDEQLEDDGSFLRSLGLATLYAGLPSLMARQVIFGSFKFLSYERASETIYSLWPFLRDGGATTLAVSLVAGGLAGSLSSVVSQPADSVLTYVSKQSGEGGKQMGVLEGSRVMVEEGGVSSLFRGLGSRCLWAGSIIAGQFFLYDIFRSAFGVTPDDLTQVWVLRL